MEITFTQAKGTIPVTIFRLTGKLDGATYQDLIAAAEKEYQAGQRDLLLDLSQISFISSAGVSALHRVALLFGGKAKGELEEGWAAFRAMDRARSATGQTHVKLLNPSSHVSEVLEMVGFTAFFEIHTDLQKAVDSFN